MKARVSELPTLPGVSELCTLPGVSELPTLPGVGEGEGVSVDVVLSLDEVLFPCDRWGVTDELPLVELLGDVVLDAFLNAYGPECFL